MSIIRGSGEGGEVVSGICMDFDNLGMNLGLFSSFYENIEIVVKCVCLGIPKQSIKPLSTAVRFKA